jgi:hypothetical protein
MPEKLDEQMDAMDEKVIKIANLYLDRIEKALKSGGHSTSMGTELSNIKFAGEGLKSLADGLESYLRVSKALQSEEFYKKLSEKSYNPDIETTEI